ncbi:hypothetical protein ASD05_14385 [Variovorax sp. Root434]|nr:hypothetical protein ASD05_14385 [Variovorax sp. Root434]
MNRTGDASLKAEDIVLQRTILPFYLPLRTPTEAQQALSSLTDEPHGMLKFRLGILTSRFRGHHPLKACAACMANDAAAFGTPYWHRAHQFPGVWLCSTHHQALKEATIKSTGVERFGWTLPHHERLRDSIEGEISAEVISMLGKLASLVANWVALPVGTHLSSVTLSRTYRSKLQDGCAPTPGKPAKRREWAKAYCDAVAALRVVPELAGLPVTEHHAMGQIERWLFHPRGNTHPLRHLSLIYWLFPEWETFWQRYVEIGSSIPKREHPMSARPEEPDPRHATVLALINSGRSASAAAAEVGVDVNTAIAWAAKAGISVVRRPKTLRPDKLSAVITDLRKGADKEIAAHRHGISVQTVTRLLRSEVGLRDIWQAARFRKYQKQARSNWSAQIARAPEIGLTALRAKQPAAYAWLYRNDRDWLLEHSRQVRLPRTRGADSKVDWDSRDTALSAEVLRVAAAIADRMRRDHVELWRLYQAIPELKAKLGALDRLPLTRAAIESVTRRHRRAEVRRLI